MLIIQYLLLLTSALININYIIYLLNFDLFRDKYILKNNAMYHSGRAIQPVLSTERAQRHFDNEEQLQRLCDSNKKQQRNGGKANDVDVFDP